jgi:predicted AlkP superfamily phosphohydrolase/phosphomutase
MSGHALRQKPRLLLIGFDSAAPDLLEEGMRDGWLPNLARLRDRGVYGRLASTSDWLVSSHWASFFLGTPPSEHGCYHFLQWRADEMALRRPDPEWMVREPFWRELADRGTRVVAFDVPYTPPPLDQGYSGVEMSGWATNELIFSPFVHPARMRPVVRRTLGRSLRVAGEGLAFERYAPRPLGELLRIRSQLIEIVEKSSQLVSELLASEPWDLFLTVFGPPHRAGHMFWSGGSVAGQAGPDVDRILQDAVRDVYAATDRAIGRVLDAAGEGTPVLVFSLIGMSHNTSRTDLLPTMLARVLAGDSGAAAAHEKLGTAKRLRKAVPVSWRHALKARLPLHVQDRLSTFWRTGRTDWGRTRAISLTADVHGYVRINLRGREAQGIVEPGAEYDRVCAEIAEGLLTFRDSRTGEPVVQEVARIDELYPTGGRRDALPDLIVRWAASPCANTTAAESPRFGKVAWPTPGKNPNGRSGNHTAEGFVVAVGDGIEPGSRVSADAHILDLPPTILALLGEDPLTHMTGRVLPEIASSVQYARRRT